MAPIDHLFVFKEKVENAVSMVATMSAEQKLEAVQFWNIMSEKLQEMVNHSAADISALALEKENKKAEEYVEDAAGQTYHLVTSTNNTGSMMALITKCKDQATKESNEEIAEIPPTKIETSKKMPYVGGKQTSVLVRTADVKNSNDRTKTTLTEQEAIKLMDSKVIKDVDSDPEGSEKCEQCHKMFTNQDLLAIHKYCHIKPYICAECDARFATKSNLIIHTRSHTGERPYKCTQCKGKFSTRGNLKRHLKSHTGEKPFPCTHCEARFTEKKSLKVHMRKHTGERPFKCTMCPKAFTQKSILQTHLALHLNQKSHLCDVCGKSFRQKSQLRLHKQRHNNVKRFTCPSCPSQFLTKGDMQRHKRTHTGERPFNCGLCKKTFTRQQTLTEHMNRHYGLKPYLCKYCRKAFAEMSACYKHIKTHERELPPQNVGKIAMDSVIISSPLASITGAPVTADEEIKYPDGLEVGSHELVESISDNPQQVTSTIRNFANSVLCKVESNKRST